MGRDRAGHRPGTALSVLTGVHRLGIERCTTGGQPRRTGDDTRWPWGHPVGSEKVRKSLVPRPCAPRHNPLNIHQPEGTTNRPGSNPRSRGGPGDRPTAGGPTGAAGRRNEGRSPFARAGTGHGAASRRTATADSVSDEDGATRPRRSRRSPGPHHAASDHRTGHPQGRPAPESNRAWKARTRRAPARTSGRSGAPGPSRGPLHLQVAGGLVPCWARSLPFASSDTRALVSAGDAA
ncbi:MAG: hypothetical protein JWL79_999 [Frankiales bacterium]|nr:hypothetical protein [Frankiales bacterium]